MIQGQSVSPLTKLANSMGTDQQKAVGREVTPGSELGISQPEGSSPATAADVSPLGPGRYTVKQQKELAPLGGKNSLGLAFPVSVVRQGSGDTVNNNYQFHSGSQGATDNSYSIYRNADLEENTDAFGTKLRLPEHQLNETPIINERQKIDVVFLKKVDQNNGATIFNQFG